MADKVKGVVDLVFLMDATGSMANCINGLKENIKLFFQSLTTKDENNSAPIKDWRAKIVGYRDYEEDGSNWLVDNDFTSDVNELYNQLDKLEADGGGDYPESLLDALYLVAKQDESEEQEAPNPQKWRPRHSAARAVIAFTDAPYKETMSAPGCENGNVDDVINMVMSKKILLTIITPGHQEEKFGGGPYDCMNILAEADKSEYIPLTDEAGNSQDLNQFAKNKALIANTLRKLAATLSKSVEAEEL